MLHPPGPRTRWRASRAARDAWASRPACRNLFGFDQPAPEILLPDPVDHDPGGERVVGFKEPAGEIEPIDAGGSWRTACSDAGDAGVGERALRGETAAFAELRRRPLESGALLHDERGRNLRGRRAPCARLSAPSRAAVEERRRRRKCVGEVVASAPRCASRPGSPARGADVAGIVGDRPAGSAAVVADEPETSDALAERAVELIQCRTREFARRSAQRSGVFGDRARAWRGSAAVSSCIASIGPRAAFARVGMPAAAGRAGLRRFECVDEVVDLERRRSVTACERPVAGGCRRDVDLDAGQAEVAVGVAAGSASSGSDWIGQRFEAERR